MIGTSIQLEEKTKNKIDFPELNPMPAFQHEEVRRGVTVADLIHAAANGFAMIVRYVLHAGVDPNEQDEHGRTAMLVASSREIRELLIQAGADRPV